MIKTISVRPTNLSPLKENQYLLNMSVTGCFGLFLHESCVFDICSCSELCQDSFHVTVTQTQCDPLGHYLSLTSAWRIHNGVFGFQCLFG